MPELSPDATKASGLCPTCGNAVCICKKEVEPLPPLRERVETEKAEREDRIERLSSMTELLFPSEEMTELRAAITSTFDVPQWGKYHNEGMYMDTHLERILETIDDIYADRFPDAVSEEMRVIIRQATGGEKEMLQRYALLHDLEKRSTLKIKREDGSDKDITWDEWRELLPDDLADNPDPVALESFLRTSDITGISYYHEEQKHGDAGANAIEGMEEASVDPLIVTAIRNHEVAFQFQNIQPVTYEEYFGDLSSEERAWVITASYMDQMGSAQSPDPENTPSKPNIDALEFLIDSKHNFETVQELRDLINTDKDIQAWKESGLKEKRIEGDVNKILGKKARLESADDLLTQIKESYAPKLIPGRLMGQLMGKVLKPMNLGREMGNVRNALIGLKDGTNLEQVEDVVSRLTIEDEHKAAIVQWLSENVLNG